MQRPERPPKKWRRSSMKAFNAAAFQVLETKWLRRPLSALNPQERQQCKEELLDGMRPYIEGIVRSMARRTQDPVEDLVQVGCIGMLKALESYDFRKYGHFRQYASYYISGELRRYLREQALIFKAPRSLQELYYRLNTTIYRFRIKEGRAPTDEELLAELKCAPTELEEVRQLERRSDVLCLEDVMFSSHSGNDASGWGSIARPRNRYYEELMDDQSPSHQHRIETGLILKDALARLTPELRDVVEMRFFQHLPQQRIAEKAGVSQMQISRRLRKALNQLQRFLM
jgi:RNA polymerase sigma-B factor